MAATHRGRLMLAALREDPLTALTQAAEATSYDARPRGTIAAPHAMTGVDAAAAWPERRWHTELDDGDPDWLQSAGWPAAPERCPTTHRRDQAPHTRWPRGHATRAWISTLYKVITLVLALNFCLGLTRTSTRKAIVEWGSQLCITVVMQLTPIFWHHGHRILLGGYALLAPPPRSTHHVVPGINIYEAGHYLLQAAGVLVLMADVGRGLGPALGYALDPSATARVPVTDFGTSLQASWVQLHPPANNATSCTTSSPPVVLRRTVAGLTSTEHWTVLVTFVGELSASLVAAFTMYALGMFLVTALSKPRPNWRPNPVGDRLTPLAERIIRGTHCLLLSGFLVGTAWSISLARYGLVSRHGLAVGLGRPWVTAALLAMLWSAVRQAWSGTQPQPTPPEIRPRQHLRHLGYAVVTTALHAWAATDVATTRWAVRGVLAVHVTLALLASRWMTAWAATLRRKTAAATATRLAAPASADRAAEPATAVPTAEPACPSESPVHEPHQGHVLHALASRAGDAAARLLDWTIRSVASLDTVIGNQLSTWPGLLRILSGWLALIGAGIALTSAAHAPSATTTFMATGCDVLNTLWPPLAAATTITTVDAKLGEYGETLRSAILRHPRRSTHQGLATTAAVLGYTWTSGDASIILLVAVRLACATGKALWVAIMAPDGNVRRSARHMAAHNLKASLAIAGELNRARRLGCCRQRGPGCNPLDMLDSYPSYRCYRRRDRRDSAAQDAPQAVPGGRPPIAAPTHLPQTEHGTRGNSPAADRDDSQPPLTHADRGGHPPPDTRRSTKGRRQQRKQPRRRRTTTPTTPALAPDPPDGAPPSSRSPPVLETADATGPPPSPTLASPPRIERDFESCATPSVYTDVIARRSPAMEDLETATPAEETEAPTSAGARATVTGDWRRHQQDRRSPPQRPEPPPFVESTGVTDGTRLQRLERAELRAAAAADPASATSACMVALGSVLLAYEQREQLNRRPRRHMSRVERAKAERNRMVVAEGVPTGAADSDTDRDCDFVMHFINAALGTKFLNVEVQALPYSEPTRQQEVPMRLLYLPSAADATALLAAFQRAAPHLRQLDAANGGSLTIRPHYTYRERELHRQRQAAERARQAVRGGVYVDAHGNKDGRRQRLQATRTLPIRRAAQLASIVTAPTTIKSALLNPAEVAVLDSVAEISHDGIGRSHEDRREAGAHAVANALLKLDRLEAPTSGAYATAGDSLHQTGSEHGDRTIRRPHVERTRTDWPVPDGTDASTPGRTEESSPRSVAETAFTGDDTPRTASTDSEATSDSPATPARPVSPKPTRVTRNAATPTPSNGPGGPMDRRRGPARSSSLPPRSRRTEKAPPSPTHSSRSADVRHPAIAGTTFLERQSMRQRAAPLRAANGTIMDTGDGESSCGNHAINNSLGLRVASRHALAVLAASSARSRTTAPFLSAGGVTDGLTIGTLLRATLALGLNVVDYELGYEKAGKRTHRYNWRRALQSTADGPRRVAILLVKAHFVALVWHGDTLVIKDSLCDAAFAYTQRWWQAQLPRDNMHVNYSGCIIFDVPDAALQVTLAAKADAMADDNEGPATELQLDGATIAGHFRTAADAEPSGAHDGGGPRRVATYGLIDAGIICSQCSDVVDPTDETLAACYMCMHTAHGACAIAHSDARQAAGNAWDLAQLPDGRWQCGGCRYRTTAALRSGRGRGGPVHAPPLLTTVTASPPISRMPPSASPYARCDRGDRRGAPGDLVIGTYNVDGLRDRYADVADALDTAGDHAIIGVTETKVPAGWQPAATNHGRAFSFTGLARRRDHFERAHARLTAEVAAVTSEAAKTRRRATAADAARRLALFDRQGTTQGGVGIAVPSSAHVVEIDAGHEHYDTLIAKVTFRSGHTLAVVVCYWPPAQAQGGYSRTRREWAAYMTWLAEHVRTQRQAGVDVVLLGDFNGHDGSRRGDTQATTNAHGRRYVRLIRRLQLRAVHQTCTTRNRQRPEPSSRAIASATVQGGRLPDKIATSLRGMGSRWNSWIDRDSFGWGSSHGVLWARRCQPQGRRALRRQSPTNRHRQPTLTATGCPIAPRLPTTPSVRHSYKLQMGSLVRASAPASDNAPAFLAWLGRAVCATTATANAIGKAADEAPTYINAPRIAHPTRERRVAKDLRDARKRQRAAWQQYAITGEDNDHRAWKRAKRMSCRLSRRLDDAQQAAESAVLARRLRDHRAGEAWRTVQARSRDTGWHARAQHNVPATDTLSHFRKFFSVNEAYASTHPEHAKIAAQYATPRDGRLGSAMPPTDVHGLAATAEEVYDATHGAAKSRSVGVDGLTAGHLYAACPAKRTDIAAARHAGKLTAHSTIAGIAFLVALTAFFNHCLLTGVYPDEMKGGRLVGINKTASPTTPRELRPVVVATALHRIYGRLLARRLHTWAARSGIINDTMFGFVEGRDSSQAAFVLRETVMARRLAPANSPRCAADHDTWVLQADVDKAYDSVPHAALLARLARLGCPPPLFRTIAAMYTDQWVTVADNTGTEVGRFPYAAGVFQGCPASPVLYLLYTADLEETLLRHPSLGVRVPYTDRRFCSLTYADDVLVLASTAEHLAETLRVLDDWATERGLRFAARKSVVLPYAGGGAAVHAARTIEFRYRPGDKVVRIVGWTGAETEQQSAQRDYPAAAATDYATTRYLGFELDITATARPHQQRRTGLGAWRNRQMQDVGVGSAAVPMPMQRLLVRGVIVPTLTYGAEVLSEPTASDPWRQMRRVTRRACGAAVGLRGLRYGSRGVMRELGVPSAQEHMDSLRIGFLFRMTQAAAGTLLPTVWAASLGTLRSGAVRTRDAGMRRNWAYWTEETLHRLGLSDVWTAVASTARPLERTRHARDALHAALLRRGRMHRRPAWTWSRLRLAIRLAHAEAADAALRADDQLGKPRGALGVTYAMLTPGRTADGRPRMAAYLHSCDARERRALALLRLDTGILRDAADNWRRGRPHTVDARLQCPHGCAATETTEHVILDCAAYATARAKHEAAVRAALPIPPPTTTTWEGRQWWLRMRLAGDTILRATATTARAADRHRPAAITRGTPKAPRLEGRRLDHRSTEYRTLDTRKLVATLARASGRFATTLLQTRKDALAQLATARAATDTDPWTDYIRR